MKYFGLLRSAVSFFFVFAITLTGFQHEITQIVESAKRVFKSNSGSLVTGLEALCCRLGNFRRHVEIAFYCSAAGCVIGMVYAINKNSGLTVGFLMAFTGLFAVVLFASAMMLFIIPNPD
jgi:hypothetical protein